MTGKLGILAGGGELPRRMVELCRARNDPFFVVAFEGHTDPATVADVDHVWIRLGAAAAALQPLRAAGVTELVMVGPVKRPGLSELRPDFKTLKFLTKLGAHSLGDDGLLRGIVSGLEAEGFAVRAADEILGDATATAGPYGVHRPDAQAERDIRRGIDVVLALGGADVGQAAVVQQGIVLGVEAVEGTDALLARCADLRRAGPGGVLVKLSKPQQDRRADLPTIGLGTLEAASAAGLRGIAFQAGETLVLDTEALSKAADDAGLFLIGIQVPA